jgi:hypothetical protein
MVVRDGPAVSAIIKKLSFPLGSVSINGGEDKVNATQKQTRKITAPVQKISRVLSLDWERLANLGIGVDVGNVYRRPNWIRDDELLGAAERRAVSLSTTCVGVSAQPLSVISRLMANTSLVSIAMPQTQGTLLSRLELTPHGCDGNGRAYCFRHFRKLARPNSGKVRHLNTLRSFVCRSTGGE